MNLERLSKVGCLWLASIKIPLVLALFFSVNRFHINWLCVTHLEFFLFCVVFRLSSQEFRVQVSSIVSFFNQVSWNLVIIFINFFSFWAASTKSRHSSSPNRFLTHSFYCDGSLDWHFHILFCGLLYCSTAYLCHFLRTVAAFKIFERYGNRSLELVIRLHHLII